MAELKTEQIDIIRKTWDIIEKDKEIAGRAFFKAQYYVVCIIGKQLRSRMEILRKEGFKIRFKLSQICAEKNDQEIIDKIMFEEFPEYLEFFQGPNLSGNAEELLANEKFAQDHIIGNVMRSVGKLVSNIDNPSTLESVLVQLGRSHMKKSVKKQHFENAKMLLTKTFKNHLSSLNSWNKEVEDAWIIFIDYVFQLIYKGL